MSKLVCEITLATLSTHVPDSSIVLKVKRVVEVHCVVLFMLGCQMLVILFEYRISLNKCLPRINAGLIYTLGVNKAT